MNLTWIVFSPLKKLGTQLFSPLASVRYRSLIPARELAQRHNIQIIPFLPPSTVNELLPLLKNADAVIFSKSVHPATQQLAFQIKQLGIRLYFDICDHHFEHPEYANYYQEMTEIADKIIVNTPYMADIVTHYTNRQTTVIADPYEGPRGLPHFLPGKTKLRLLWFGHPVNLDTLTNFIPQLLNFAQTIPLELHLVSMFTPQFERIYFELQQQVGKNLSLRFSPWSLTATWNALHATDIVIIPSLPTEQKRPKSANRLIESIQAGRFVVAYPLPAYQPFAQWVWVNDQLITGIEWALQHPQQVIQQLTQAQSILEFSFSPVSIARQWEQVLNQP